MAAEGVAWHHSALRSSKHVELLAKKSRHIDFQNISGDVRDSLHTLSRVASILGIEDVLCHSYSPAISYLFYEELCTKRSLNRMKHAEHELSRHLASAKHEEHLVVKWTQSFEKEFEQGQSNTLLERQRVSLVSKAKEYQKELENIKTTSPASRPVTITELFHQRDHIRKKEQDIKAKRARIKAFKGLPPNLELARHELRNARHEQMKLIQLRERLLGKMADGIS